MGNESNGTVLPTMGEDVTGTVFEETGRPTINKTEISEKYHNLTGPHGTTDVDIESLANKIIELVDTQIFTDVDEMYSLDQAMGVETFYNPYERQVINRINRTLRKNGDVTTEDVVDHLVESYIYQYKKEYVNQKDVNTFLRHEFKDDLNNMIYQIRSE